MIQLLLVGASAVVLSASVISASESRGHDLVAIDISSEIHISLSLEPRFPPFWIRRSVLGSQAFSTDLMSFDVFAEYIESLEPNVFH